MDESNKSLPLKEEIGKGAYFHKDKDLNTIKIVPYTFNKIETNTTGVSSDGRIKYIIENKIISISLK